MTQAPKFGDVLKVNLSKVPAGNKAWRALFLAFAPRSYRRYWHVLIVGGLNHNSVVLVTSPIDGYILADDE